MFLNTEASCILPINLIHYEEQRKLSWLGSAHAELSAAFVPPTRVKSSASSTG